MAAFFCNPPAICRFYLIAITYLDKSFSWFIACLRLKKINYYNGLGGGVSFGVCDRQHKNKQGGFSGIALAKQQTSHSV